MFDFTQTDSQNYTEIFTLILLIQYRINIKQREPVIEILQIG